MKKLIIIAGATASGKTNLSIEIAQHYQTEIISADSRQCYRELNIGVAKPSIIQLEKITHHFINSHSIHDEVSAGIFERYALEKLELIFHKNDVAVCVGGTGMYLHALCNGIDNMPPVDQKIYAELESEFKANGITWLQEQIKEVDNAFFLQGEIHNPSRILRALSFKLSNGTSILDYRKNNIIQRSFDIIPYVIEINRDNLYHRINERVDSMIEAGLIDEVNNLKPFESLKSLNTVGYTELFAYFNNQSTLKDSIAKIKQHTRNYAKRQITWFKNQGNYQWLKPDQILLDLINKGF